MTDAATVAVVGYNDAGTIERCIRSLRSNVTMPITIVDNHSDDDTWNLAESLASGLDAITAIRTDFNGGYAYAGNVARARCTTRYLAVMNMDCVTTGDWITPIVAYLDANPDVAGCSPTVAVAGSEVLNSEGLDIHKTGFGFNRHLGQSIEDAAGSPTDAGGLQGTAFVVRVSALDQIGGWYAGGFLYHEDVELSWALRLAGFRLGHVPTPPLLHDYELTMSPEKFFLLERNRLEMLATHLGPRAKARLAPALVAVEAAVWLYALAKRSGLPGAKLRSYRSLTKRKDIRRSRRRAVTSFRRVPDHVVLAAMSWAWPRPQTAALLDRPASSGRRGDRHLPTA